MNWRENGAVRYINNGLDRIDKSAMSTMSSLALIGGSLTGTLTKGDKAAYRKIINDQDRRENNRQRINQNAKRRSEYKQLIDDYNESSGLGAVKQIGRRVVDAVKHPEEIDLMSQWGSMINPLNYIPVGKSASSISRGINLSKSVPKTNMSQLVKNESKRVALDSAQKYQEQREMGKDKGESLKMAGLKAFKINDN